MENRREYKQKGKAKCGAYGFAGKRDIRGSVRIAVGGFSYRSRVKFMFYVKFSKNFDDK
jgi:hypothetical protein